MASNSSAASLEEYEAEGIKVGIDVTYQEPRELEQFPDTSLKGGILGRKFPK